MAGKSQPTTKTNKTRQQSQVRHSRPTPKLRYKDVISTTPSNVAFHGDPYFYVLQI